MFSPVRLQWVHDESTPISSHQSSDQIQLEALVIYKKVVNYWPRSSIAIDWPLEVILSVQPNWTFCLKNFNNFDKFEGKGAIYYSASSVPRPANLPQKKRPIHQRRAPWVHQVSTTDTPSSVKHSVPMSLKMPSGQPRRQCPHTQAGILPRFKLCFRDFSDHLPAGSNEKCRVRRKWYSEFSVLRTWRRFYNTAQSAEKKRKRKKDLVVANAAANQMIKWCLCRPCVARSWLLTEK